MSDHECWREEAEMVVAYRRWRETLRRGWRRYTELLGEAGVLWPGGPGDDAALLEFALPEIPDLYTVEDLETLALGEAAAPGPEREVTESSARRRPTDGDRSSSVQHPSLRSFNR